MFRIGDHIIYGAMGVCLVKDLSVPSFCQKGEERQYYTLAPLNQNGEILVPVDADVFMRPIIDREEAERLIGRIPTIRAQARQDCSTQELKNYYTEALRAHDCAELIELVMSIYVKKLVREQQNQKIGQIDEACMKRAEGLLHDEFALALGIEAAAVPDYIRARVEQG